MTKSSYCLKTVGNNRNCVNLFTLCCFDTSPKRYFFVPACVNTCQTLWYFRYLKVWGLAVNLIWKTMPVNAVNLLPNNLYFTTQNLPLKKLGRQQYTNITTHRNIWESKKTNTESSWCYCYWLCCIFINYLSYITYLLACSLILYAFDQNKIIQCMQHMHICG